MPGLILFSSPALLIVHLISIAQSPDISQTTPTAAPYRKGTYKGRDSTPIGDIAAWKTMPAFAKHIHFWHVELPTFPKPMSDLYAEMLLSNVALSFCILCFSFSNNTDFCMKLRMLWYPDFFLPGTVFLALKQVA